MRTFILSLIFFLSCMVKGYSIDSFQPAVVNDSGRIEIYFTPNLTFEDLIKIKKDVSERGIFLTYHKLQFNRKGKLKAIGFSVECKEGFKGTAEAKVTEQSGFGFFRDYDKSAVAPFGVGHISRQNESSKK